ncbi:RhuM family protein, partial [Thiolapillus sp.]
STFTMESFAESVNKFLAFNEYQILEGYGQVSRKQAELKAFAEYEKFNKQQKIESDFDREVKKLLQKKDTEA